MRKQDFINALVARFKMNCNPNTPFDNGFNTGLIEALNLARQLDEFEPAEDNPEDVQFNKIKVFCITNVKGFHLFGTGQVKEFIEFLRGGNKLSAVKLHYEITNKQYGLKGSKEEIDKITDAFFL